MTVIRTGDAFIRYDGVAVALHWLIGLAMLGQIAFGFLLDTLAPRGTPARASTINVHKFIGLVLFVLVAARLLWRLRHAPPAMPASMPHSRSVAARWGHRALYAAMLLVPLAGYAASNFSKYGVRLFGVHLMPWGPDLPRVYRALDSLHAATAWLLTAMIAGHIAMALKHALIDRDGVFSRMWPGTTR